MPNLAANACYSMLRMLMQAIAAFAAFAAFAAGPGFIFLNPR